MPTIAVTGHMDLTEATVQVVGAALHDLLAEYSDGHLVGVSCIAAGSDSLFAEAVLASGGRLVVVVPGHDYRRKKVKSDHAATFDSLAGAAAELVTVPGEAGREAYEAAGKELLNRADRLVAVWDGRPSAGQGGTADTVAQARALGIPVDVVWPEGAARR